MMWNTLGNGHAMQETVLTILTTTLLVCLGADALNYMKHPFGIKMCELLCQNINYCTTYMFRMPSLSCHVSNISSTSVSLDRKGYLYNISQRNRHVSMDQTCPRQFRMFRSRGRQLMCEKDERQIQKTLKQSPNFGYDNHNRQDSTRKTVNQGTRLLIVTRTRRQNVNEVSLQGNHFIKKYPYIKWQGITAIAYIWSKRQILVSLFHTRIGQIVSHNLDNSKYRIIHSHLRCDNLAVDEKRDLVFLVMSRSVGKMTTEGKEFKTLKQVNSVTPIAVLPKIRHIILIHQKCVFRMSYEGKSFTKVSCLKPIKGITADPAGNVLYVSNEKRILTMSSSGHVRGVMHSFEQEPDKIVYYQNNLFIHVKPPTKRATCLWKLDLLTNSTQRILSNQEDMALCVIP